MDEWLTVKMQPHPPDVILEKVPATVNIPLVGHLPVHKRTQYPGGEFLAIERGPPAFIEDVFPADRPGRIIQDDKIGEISFPDESPVPDPEYPGRSMAHFFHQEWHAENALFG
jgi:hypothetical protein